MRTPFLEEVRVTLRTTDDARECVRFDLDTFAAKGFSNRLSRGLDIQRSDLWEIEEALGVRLCIARKRGQLR